MPFNAESTFKMPQLIPSHEASQLASASLFDDADFPDRFELLKQLMHRFSQALMGFLHKTHERNVCDWIGKNANGQWVAGSLSRFEGVYPPHVIALRDLVHFLDAASDSFGRFNQLLTSARCGLIGFFSMESNQNKARGISRDLFIFVAVFTVFWQISTDKKIQKLMYSWKRLQKSIGAIKQLPIHNGIIDSAINLYEQIGNYFQGGDDHLLKIFWVLKDALGSSELLALKQDQKTYDSLLENKLSVKAKLELYYWQMLLATSDEQRKEALLAAKKIGEASGSEGMLKKITQFAEGPAWGVQSLAFAQQLPAPSKSLALTPEKVWLYTMQLKSIIARVIDVSPEFMAEDNDAGNMLRMIGTLKRLPSDMVKKIDHAWFVQVMSWLQHNYVELCKDDNLTRLVNSIYNLHTNFLADLDELETHLGLKFGLLTHDIPEKLSKLMPHVALSAAECGPAESLVRSQAGVVQAYSRKQVFFRAQQRIARLVYQEYMLEKKKMAMGRLMESNRPQDLSHLHLLDVQQLEKLKGDLLEISQSFPEIKSLSLGQYLEKKLDQINCQIAFSESIGYAYLGSMILAARSGLWVFAEHCFVSLNMRHDEQVEIAKTLAATQVELNAPIARERAYLQIAWDTYQANTQNQESRNIPAKLKNYQALNERIEKLQKKINLHSLEDVQAQQASKEDRKLLGELLFESEKALLELRDFLDISEQTQRAEKDKALERLERSISENNAANAVAQKQLGKKDAVLLRFSQMKLEDEFFASTANEFNEIQLAEKVVVQEKGAVEHFQSLLDEVIKPLSEHIANEQLYKDDAYFQGEAFDIRVCDTSWIAHLKRMHNVLLELKQALAVFQRNASVKVPFINIMLPSYQSYLQLIDSLLKLVSQLGDVLGAMNKFAPYWKENWIDSLSTLYKDVQAFLFTESGLNPVAKKELLASSKVGDSIQAGNEQVFEIPLKQKMNEDFQELLVELPSNLPNRAQLDSDLTHLFSIINEVLGSNAVATVGGNGLMLINSVEFKRLIDNISKVSALMGSDFVYEKISSYRLRLTAYFSSAMKKILAEELNMGYKPGVITSALYQQVELLADYGLLDVPALYAAQFIFDDKVLSEAVKAHFNEYVEKLLIGYAQKQDAKWAEMRKVFSEKLKCITADVQKLQEDRKKMRSGISTEGKDLDTKQQGLELQKAQIHRQMLAEERSVKFLRAYVGAVDFDQRKLLVEHQKRQQEALALLNRVVRQLTTIKWDLYYYEFIIFENNVEKINELIGLFEKYIEMLVEGQEHHALHLVVAKIKDMDADLPPVMAHLSLLARNIIKRDFISDDKPNAVAVGYAERNDASDSDDDPIDHAIERDVSIDVVTYDKAIIEPSESLAQRLIDYARDAAGQLDVKDDWYRRNIFDYLEVFTEMWSPEKVQNPVIIKRRKEILSALQSKHAPDYRFLSDPVDVKIVYLLTVLGEYGLGFHEGVFSKESLLEANKQITDLPLTAAPVDDAYSSISVHPAPLALEVATNKTCLSLKKEGEFVSFEEVQRAIALYQDAYRVHAFFSSRQGGGGYLSDKNIAYLLRVAKNHAVEKASEKGCEKLRAIYNALLRKDVEALRKAVDMRTGRYASNAQSEGGFKAPGLPRFSI